MPTLTKIDPTQIRTDGGTQPRAKIDRAVCCEYAERMKAGEQFPPVTVFHDGNCYWLADGFHRIDAHQSVFPGQPLQCEVRSGSQTDAQWYSYGVNKTHGIRRSNQDKERAVKAALAHPRATTLSNRQIAEHCGVNEVTIRRYRNEAESTAALPQWNEKQDPATTSDASKSRPRTGRDGRTINTAHIGKGKKGAGKRGRKGSGISPRANMPTRGHSAPLRMIPLQLCPDNPQTAAATLCQLFERDFLTTLIAEITRRIEGDE